MKKFVNFVFAFIMLFVGSTLVGCGARYAGLSVTASISYPNANSTVLDNGSKRVATDVGVFDVNADGSYTFYISNSSYSSAELSIVFSNAPSDFIFGADFEIDNEIVSVAKSFSSIANGIKTTITAKEVGSCVLTVRSSEGEVSDSLHINVVKSVTALTFDDDSLGLVNKSGASIDLSNHINQFDETKFSFGKMNGEFFEEISSSNLLTEYGINYNAKFGVLTVVQDQSTLKS